MTDTLVPLAADFPAPDESRWRGLVEKALKGAPFERLVTPIGGGLAIKPLYRETDVASAQDPAGFPGAAPFARGGAGWREPHLPWDIRQSFDESDSARLNADVLDDLAGGVSSLELRIDSAGVHGIRPGDLGAALQGVLLDLAPIALDRATPEAAEALAALAPGDAAAAFNLDPFDDAAVSAAVSLAPRFAKARLLRADARLVHEAGGTADQEIGYALAAGLAGLRALEKHGVPTDRAAGWIEFAVALGPDVLVEAAKLRALRLAWARLTEACGAAAPARIHAVSGRRVFAKRDAWTNLLRATAATAAAAFGGAEVIGATPLTDALGRPDAFARRLARNTQIILMEESRLGHVIDPAGGAWFVERLTQDLAEAGWRVFQEIEREGGAVAARAGAFARAVALAREAQAKAYAARKAAITGVTDFPLLQEQAPAFRPRPPQPKQAGDLAPIRWAEPFERLRDAAEPKSPRAFFATLGPLASFSVRANFARNLLGVAGIEAIGPEAAYETGAERRAAFEKTLAPVAVICGTDEAYGAEAAETAAALKAAGAVWVALAGRPGEREAALREAGVDQFLFAGQDALDALTTLLAAFGVKP